MSSSGFLPATNYFPAEMRQGLATTPVLADLDGDGRTDIVLRSKYGNSGSAYGSSVHGFQAWHNTAAGWERFATDPLLVDDGAGGFTTLATEGGFAFADIDHDGKLELVATSSGGGDTVDFRVLRLDGGALHELTGAANPLDGVLLPDSGKILDSMPGAVSVVDYDGDGRLDIVVGSAQGDSGLWALHNTGSGYVLDTTTFADVVTALGDADHIAPAFTDLDGDGHLDLVVASQAGSGPGKYAHGAAQSFLFDTTSGTFQPAATDPLAGLTLPRQPVPVFTDLDGDGRQDLVTGDKYGHLSAFRHEADGSFTALDTPGSIVGVAGQPSFIDLDGDGRLDMIPGLISALTTGSGFVPMHNVGNGLVPFDTNPFVDIPASSGRAVSVDLTGDGVRDVLFLDNLYSGGQTVDSFENLGGSFARMASDPFAAVAGDHHWIDAEVADLNGDGRDDLIVLDSHTHALQVLLGDGAGFVEDATNPLDGFSTGISNVVGFDRVDLDADGDLDLVASDILGTLHSFENQGGTYAPFAVDPIGGGSPIGALPLWNGPVFTDVDGDGRLDFVGMDQPLSAMKYGDPSAVLTAQTPAVWLHTATGWEKMAAADNPYRTVAIYPTDLPLLSFADLDGDGHMEAMRSEKYGRTELIGVLGLQLRTGTTGADPLTGTADADILRGLTGNDTIDGRDGDDVLAGGAGADQLKGGLGSDTADYNDSAAAVNVSLATNRGLGGDAEGDRLNSIENLAGSTHDDTLTGGDGDNRLDGRAGNDSLNGGDGQDTLLGGDGADSLGGGNGNDSLEGGAGADRLIGYAGDDTLAGGEGDDKLTGAAGNDSIDGGAGSDDLYGVTGDDTLSGGDGDDSIAGNDGNDLLIGGMGADTLSGGDGADVFRWMSASEGGDRVSGYNRVDDVIEVSAAGFGGGLVAGSAAAFVANLTGLASSAAGVGQFIWDKDDRVLLWDHDGAGGDAAVAIASFVGIAGGANGFNAAEIQVIA